MATAVLVQSSPVMALLVVLIVAASAWYVSSGDYVPLTMAVDLLVVAVVGMVGSFVLHEAAHLAVLVRLPGVTGVAVESTMLRVSLLPSGRMTRRQAALVAVAGPLACVATAGVLQVLPGTAHLSWWYLAHLTFLLPCFGDGRALLSALLASTDRAGGA